MRLFSLLTPTCSYLWPGYTEEASNYHVLLTALIVNVKRREHLETWTLFEDKPIDFSFLFRRVLSMTLDRTLAITIRTQLLSFLIHAFQSLDCTIVRKECAPLVAIGIWHNLSSDKMRDAHLDQAPHLRKAWRCAQRRYDAADDATKARLRFERSWLYTLLLDFINTVYEEKSKPGKCLSKASVRLRPLTNVARIRTVLRAIHRVRFRLAKPASYATICQRGHSRP